ncbi:hypothetical protein AB0B50_25805 [Streptomyces sp. NPDC041068]|uniref:hypothetical protein n=1 Tax=Streptomyces sp. NPDC041068 TaxID=3155130 RepID=UPI0033FD8DE4
MDAGLAAVLGALAGGIGTTLAGMAAGWASREQARITARAEHRRLRQGPREGAYTAFIGAAGALRDHAIPMFFGVEEILDRPPLTEEFLREAPKHMQAVVTAWLTVTLAGPRSVQGAASDIYDCSMELTSHGAAIYSLAESGVGEEHIDRIQLEAHHRIVKLNNLLGTFTELAQQVLDDDGTI